MITWDGERLQLSITRDITERRQMELALRESEERHRLLFEHSLDAILFTSPDGSILDANPAACRLFDRTVEELRAGGRASVLDTSDPRLPQALETRARLGQWTGELNILRKDGTRFPCEVSSALFTDRHGHPKTSVIIRDISERKQAEALRQQLNAEIQQSQKLDSLGSLAGGVAHDMNNILAAIQAVIETLRMNAGDDARLLPSLGLIDRAAVRGRDLVKGLTKFARKDLQEAEVLNLNLLVEEETHILRRTTLQKVELVMDLEGALRPVLGERNSLASALMNLCVNAVDAMPEGGTLTLRTRNLPEARVELVVEDTGVGMSPEVAARAMDPFFTTKPIGKGTGLGLAMAYATAQTHGGTLSLRSEPGRGTAVSLRLPAIQEAASAQGPHEATPQPGGALKILLVDDDDLILAAAPPMIEGLGHRVITASGGAEALATLESGASVDLLILDLNMPGMNGLETLGLIRRGWSNLPVLLATGHLDERAEQVLKDDPRTLPMAKPYSVEELNRKLQALGVVSA
jgi:PAS domain S-box-containing protein